MKIAFYIQSITSFISGGRQYPWFCAHCLAARGHQVTIFTNFMPIFDRDFQDFEGKNNIKIIVDNCFGQKDKDVMKSLRHYDFFIAAPVRSLDYGVSLAKINKKKIIGMVYEPENFYDEAASNGVDLKQVDEVSKRDMRIQYGKVDLILCNNKITQEYAKRSYPNSKVSYLYNGFLSHIADKVKTVSEKDREDYVVFLSRMVPYKGFGDIPYIFGQLDKKLKIQLITGFLDRKDQLNIKFFSYCAENGMDITVHEKITEYDKFKLLSKAKALFFPSRFEGFGIPPAESLYMKTPVMCYGLPVLKEVYREYPHYMDWDNYQPDLNSALRSVNDLFNGNELFRDIDAARNHVASFGSEERYKDNIDNLVCKFMGKPTKEISFTKASITPIQFKKHEDILFSVIKFGENVQHSKSLNSYNVSMVKEIFDKNIESKYLVLVKDGISINAKLLNEARNYIENTNFDLYVSDYYFKSTSFEKKLPEFSIEMMMLNPGCFGGLLIVKKDSLLKYKDNIYNWELDIPILMSKDKIGHIKESIFLTPSHSKFLKSEVIDKFKQYILGPNPFYLKQLNDHKYGIMTADNPNDKKSLIITCARTDKHIYKMTVSLNTQVYLEHDNVLCHHEPDRKYNQNLIDNFKKFGKILKFKGEFNFSRMNNKAVRKFCKDHEYIILINDDIVLNPHSINELLRMFDYKWDKVGIVGAKLLYPENDKDVKLDNEFWIDQHRKIQHAGVVLMKDVRCYHRLLRKKACKLSVSYPKLIDAVTFAFVAIKTECYKEVKLDKEYPNDLNDIDFCVRARQKGWNIVYNPLSTALHLETATRKEFDMTQDSVHKQKFADQYKSLLSICPTIQEFNNVQGYYI